jgi:hypothetical protein
MFKKGLIFGLLGFFISLVSVNSTSTDKNVATLEAGSLRYEDGINGWISFGTILEESINEAFLNEDDFFVSMFMWKTMERLPEKPEIIVTGKDNLIFWTSGSAGKGTEYTGWPQRENNKDFLIGESLSKIKINIFSDKTTIAGYLFLEIQNKPDPKEFDIMGWKNYGAVISSSNTIRSNISERNVAGIKSFVDKVTKRDDILKLTILSGNETVIWDINNADIGKKIQGGGWINQEKDKNEPDRFYLSFPVEYEERKIADIHFLVKLPIGKGPSFFAKIIFKFKNLLKPAYLKVSLISFLIFFILGGVLSKAAPVAGGKIVKAKGIPGLENKIQALKEEIENLETTKAEVMEEVAKKQKVQKDLENEIELLSKKKETVSTEATFETETEEIEEEKTEESLLFDDLLGEKGKTNAKKKEELEITQRIVAKRREEIDLSGKVESRRKELLELERKIENLKNK